MAEKVIRVGDLPGMRAFFDAVTALVEAVNAEPVPSAVLAAADRVRAETLGIGDGDLPAVTVEEEERSAGRLENEARLRTAMGVARDKPGVPVNVDWVPE